VHFWRVCRIVGLWKAQDRFRLQAPNCACLGMDGPGLEALNCVVDLGVCGRKRQKKGTECWGSHG
jgi:hypothetical protein